MLPRRFVTEPNDCVVGRVAVKVVIEIFECTIGGLRVQEVDHGQEEDVHRGEDCDLSALCTQTLREKLTDVEAEAKISDANRRELRADKSEDPVGSCSCCSTAGTHAQGVDLGLIDPRDHPPRAAEGGVVEE